MSSYLDILQSPKRPKIGVVLSSGGIRPVAAIELFEFFEQAHIPIDLLVGCSGGGIASVLKALGHTSSEMRQIIAELLQKKLFQIDYRTMAALLRLPFSRFSKDRAMLRNDPILENFEKLTVGCTFQDLKIKTILQATDWETGEEVRLKNGHLAKAMYASSACMPFLPPIYHEGRWLVDGGFSTFLPVLEAVSSNVDIIIAMDFNNKHSYHPKGLMQTFEHFITLYSKEAERVENMLATDMHIHEIVLIDVYFDKPIQMWEKNALPLIFTQGKIAVEKAKKQIIHAIETFGNEV